MLAINESAVQNQLEQWQIDFALVTPDFQALDIHAKNLYDERYICAVRHDHPIAKQSQLTLEQFCRLEQALISYHGGSFSGYRPCLASDGITKKRQPVGTKFHRFA